MSSIPCSLGRKRVETHQIEERSKFYAPSCGLVYFFKKDDFLKSKKPLPQKLLTVQSHTASERKTTDFPIVGIGASAGGLEAFEQFFRHVPIDSGMAFVLVSHLAPDHASLLSEILQRITTMQVNEALDQILVEPGCVYVIPPNRDMVIIGGALQLTIPEQPRRLRMPIDAFLRSLAQDQQENAIGIILSGTGTDGTLGLRAILGAGGFTLVQEPATAKYDGMPFSAIQAGYATHILPVEKMPEALLIDAQTFIAHTEISAAPKSVNGIISILRELCTITGHDFKLYKKSTIERRFKRRMSRHNIRDVDVYVRYLKENPAEAHELFKELLITVTSFFRDPDAFDVLKKDILPLLFDDKPDNYVFRVWVAACATGEEAYSIAILLRELMEEAHKEFDVQIYSTDLNDKAIAIARGGNYPLNIVQDVTPERLRRFFVKEDTGYRIKKEIRGMVVFAVHNVIKDPPFTKLDLLCCRNLMIYLEPELKNRLIATFHYTLKPGGVLFLSPSESIGNHNELFTAFNRRWNFFRAKDTAVTNPAMPALSLIWTAGSGSEPSGYVMEKPKETNYYTELTRKALVQCFAPASVVTDLKGDTIYVHGETGKYLRPAPGQASLNVIEMARIGLEMELRAAIHAAASEGTPTLNREMQVNTSEGYLTVSLSVRLLPDPDGNDNLLLVSFQDIVNQQPANPGRKRVTKQVELKRIEELERDLSHLKEIYQATVEEQQATNEELKSTNEEMQSTNEELRSSNEELETSKEELQSVNEELITVNSELKTKIKQLYSIQNDMKNLLDNINIDIIFLDRYLVIRSFTRDAIHIYRLVASDVGRPLNDIKSLIQGDDLLAAAQNVLDSLIPYECEIKINNESWMLARIQLYRTLDNMIDGVVLTFTDITSRIKNQTDLCIYATAFETQEGIFITDASGVILKVNQAFTKITGYSAEAAIGQTARILKSGRQDPSFYTDLWESIISTGVWHGEIYNQCKNGEIFPHLLSITGVKGEDGVAFHYVASLVDITLQKAASEQIEQLAFYDSLTHLPNRRLLKDRLHQALASSARRKQHGALLFIDLDNFKTLNDTLGHDIGDLLLQQVAQRLLSSVREEDTVGRLGGDEFVVMLEELSENPEEAAVHAEIAGKNILATLNKSFLLAGRDYRCTSSIGATLFYDHTKTEDDLLKHVDIAMYQAKHLGRNTLCFFDQAMHSVLIERAAMEANLRLALEKNQFKLYYQMQTTRGGQIVGAEMLIRWQHPEHGLILPMDFIPLAEETGLILSIGQWELEMACAQLKIWKNNPQTEELQLAVNVSARHLQHIDFVDQIKVMLEKYGIEPNRLKMELTEGIVLNDIHGTIAKMQALKSTGVRLALDDFGTGFSSLSYLTQLPLDQLKIDQSFVRNINMKHSDALIVQTIIGMANNLGLEVIAEGVETEIQRAFLEKHGCCLYQGYLFSTPVPLEAFEQLLQRNCTVSNK